MKPPPASPSGLKIHPRVRTIELRRAILIGGSGLIFVGGFVVFALWRTLGAIDAAARYANGAVALLCALLAAVITTGTLREVRVSWDRLTLAAELVQNGELALVELLESKRDEKGFRVMFRYRYRTPSGAVLEGSIASAEGGAYRVNESERQSLALLSQDGRRGLLLTRSGYPLLNVSEIYCCAPVSQNRTERESAT